jgi:hypothetical protein
MLLVVQYGLGGLGVMFIPALVPLFGTAVLFLALVAFSTVTLVMLAFLPTYEIDEQESLARAAAHTGVRAAPLILTIVSLFLFQAANMGLYAYIIGLGEHYGLELPFISGTLGVAAWLGLAGAALVVIMADRLGYLFSLAGGIALTVVGSWALLYSHLPWVWILSNCLIGITWAYTVAYLFGLMSRYDTTGQMAALGGFASKMGLASGPVAAAALLGQDDYGRVIWAAVFALVVSLLAIIRPALLQRRAAAS